MMVIVILKTIMIVRLGDGPATPSKHDVGEDGEEIDLGMMMTLVIELVLIMIMIIMMMMMMMMMMIQTW